ncbi:uncharacterized protein YjdB [Kitasatospora sp. MAA4]|uniref:hypothetical protein n=1 Tax=Kitasatospora sp. MAA4 TaxID=3035093 RepID=UPI0024770A56|nr:hypothetical protein [Kitasatospora sp. MAA4]MDH6132304.1 uncharacterized protein YjdB [Kitasatospora sp. MAA4]
MKRNRRTPAGVLAATLLMAGLTMGAAPAPAADPDGGRVPPVTVAADPATHAALVAAAQRAQAENPNSQVRHICYAAHVQNIGWQPPVCDGRVAGTQGQSLRLEALDILVTGIGGVCADAYEQYSGWQGWRCGDDATDVVVGTTGQSLRMEALAVSVASGGVCVDGYVQNTGWQQWQCADAMQTALVGTTGQSLRLEAVAMTV